MREFGIDPQLIDMPVTPQLLAKLRNEIIDQIETWEDRVKVENIKFVYTDEKLYVTIQFRIKERGLLYEQHFSL